jgi:signal transduction histidine kinase
MQPNSNINQWLTDSLLTFSKAVCFVVFFIGLLAALGWTLNITAFKSILPALPVISPNTAIALILASISLWLLQESRKQKPIRFLGYSLAMLVALLGFFTLVEYFLKLNLGLDNLLFKSALSPGGLPIRMSPQSAVNFLILGFSLLLINRQTKTGKQPSQYLVLIIGIISLLSFFGFVNNITSFYTISPYKGMAAHTAVAFILLFLAIFASRPASGLMKVFSGSGISSLVARRLLVALAAVMASDILIMAGHANGFYGHETEAIMHAVLISIAFIYLMFIGLASLDKIQSIEEVSRIKSEFVSFVSHQLRTPLTAIKWSADTLLHDDPPPSEKQKEYLETIHASANQTISLADAFLNVSKIERGTFLTGIAESNLQDITEEILRELNPQIQAKKINIEKNCGGNLDSVKIDPKLVQAVLQNLISNAVKYTQNEGHITIAVNTGKNEILVEIKDDGVGIPPGQQDKIFTKLFRAKNIQGKTAGSGIGLYMVKTLLEQIGGKIRFESKENEGTTFYVSMPVKNLL